MSEKLVPGKWYKENSYSYSLNQDPDDVWFDLPDDNCTLLFLGESCDFERQYHEDDTSLKFLWNGKVIYCHYVVNSTDFFKKLKEE